MGVPPGNASRGTAGLVSVPKRYVAGADTRGRQEGRSNPWSQQVSHEISGLMQFRQILAEFFYVSHGPFEFIGKVTDSEYRLHSG